MHRFITGLTLKCYLAKGTMREPILAGTSTDCSYVSSRHTANSAACCQMEVVNFSAAVSLSVSDYNHRVERRKLFPTLD